VSYHHELYKDLPQGTESWPSYCKDKKRDGIRFIAVDLEKQKPPIFFKAQRPCQLFFDKPALGVERLRLFLHSILLIK